MKKILILKTGELDFDKELIGTFVDLGRGDEISYTLSHYKDVEVLIDGSDIQILVDNVNLKNYDLIYFKSWIKQRYLASVIAQVAIVNKIKYFDASIKDESSAHKLFQSVVLALNNINVPKTFFVNSPDKINWDYVSSKMGGQFVVKACLTREGDKNYLIKSEDDFDKIKNEILSEDYIFQEFIPNDFDYRCVVLGDKTAYIKKRERKDKSIHKNNVALGAEVTYLPLNGNEDLATLARRSAKLFLIDIAGVDIVTSKLTGVHYVLEVNKSPALRHDLSVLKYIHNFFRENI